MPITTIPGADEKNAKLSLNLRADSGYSADSSGHRVSVNQWAAILSIAEDSNTGKALMASPEVLEAASSLLDRLYKSHLPSVGARPLASLEWQDTCSKADILRDLIEKTRA